MAVLLLESDNNFTSSNWKTVDATSYQGSEAQNALLSTSYTSSASFTPGAITVEGLLVKIISKSASPTGTMDIRLFNVTDSTQTAIVTVNVTDIQSPTSTTGGGGWHYFKFGSPVTLTAGKAYRVELKTSSASQVTVYRDATATNWSRGLVTSTTAAPGASDVLIIAGPITGAGASTVITCTHNNTASTAFDQTDVGANGKWILQNSASTAYRFDTANNSLVRITCNAICEFGTSSARIPSTSSMTWNLASSAVQGNYMDVRSGASFTMYGQDKTRFARAAADFSNGATSITTDVSTGWKNGDTIGIGATARSATPSIETKALTADASGTSLTISAVGTGKSGTSPVQVPLINLTSNAKMTGTSTTNTFAVRISGSSPTVDFDNVQFDNIGGSNTNPTLRGVTFGTSSGAGTLNVRLNKCAFATGNTSASLIDTAQSTAWNGTVVITGNVGYGTAAMINIVATSGTATNCQVNDNVAIGQSSFGFFCSEESFEIKNNVVNGGTGTSNFQLNLTNNTATISGNRCEVCANQGFVLTLAGVSASSFTAYRCNAYNMQISSCKDSIIDTVTLFGAATANMIFGTGTFMVENSDFRNMTIDSGVTNTCPIGITTSAGLGGRRAYFSNCLLGTNQTHSTSDFACNTILGEFIFRNSTLASSTQVSTPTNMGSMTSVRLQRSGGSAGLHRSYWRSGRGDSDTTIINSGTVRSLRLTPSSASLKLTHPLTMVNVRSGETATITVAIRKSVIGDGAAYNGNQPRLLVRSNPAAGSSFNSEIVAATATSANGVWETISYTTPAVTDDTALEFNVDCDGTTGWINVQTVRAS